MEFRGLGPFRPGTGAKPPYLAGRGAEQALFRALLEDLAQGTPPGTQVVLYGPRGNGKTVLLDWLTREVGGVPKVSCSVLQPAELHAPSRLVELLAPTAWWQRLLRGDIGAGGFSWRPARAPAPATVAVLSARAKAKALILLVDEAHTLDLEVGRVLLNAAQEAGRKQPFLLVLAGTPNLEGRLNAMGASFWNRARQLRIGRLDEDATVEAFRRPFNAGGLRVSEDILRELSRQSQHYPFFVQLLGEAVWGQATAGSAAAPEVTRSALAAGAVDFERTANEFYAQRFEEFATQGLVPVGRAVAEIFRGRRAVKRHELEDAIAAGLGGSDPAATTTTLGALRDLGFVWRIEGSTEWEPGIPSLMDYVLEHAPLRQ